MTLDRRTNNGIKATRAGNGALGAGAAASSKFASAQERRVMKKVTQPEHAYTGCVPYTPADDDESDVAPKKKHPPILGYRGHLRYDEDRIGTTFTQGLAVASRAAEPARLPSNKPRQVRFAEDKVRQLKPSGLVKDGMSPRSGYGQFDNASGYGAFAAPPKAGMSPRSGYGAFDNASGYGAFAAPPLGGGSGYGAFDNASGYGAFAARPERGGLSPRSGYGEFDNASGYGAFAAPAAQTPGAMSPRSGYGAFDNASGYGAFAAPPAQKGMSPRSGYGEFDNASGYGAFAAPPGGIMSSRSGYGEFDNASGYGNFASPPDPVQAASKPDPARTRGFEPNVPIHQGEIDKLIDGEREYRVHASNNQIQENWGQHRNDNRANKTRTPSDPVLQAKYQQAIYRVGGEQAAVRLWLSAVQTIWQRFMTRTDLLQAVKRSFEKHERTNHGFMTKAQLKETLRDLACVFTDDQRTPSLQAAVLVSWARRSAALRGGKDMQKEEEESFTEGVPTGPVFVADGVTRLIQMFFLAEPSADMKAHGNMLRRLESWSTDVATRVTQPSQVFSMTQGH
ncbi:hypothetical protein PHYPSEUDO_001164 [Phytophthora pseudosyringae]|uniref:Uncharacterized protein n=1 Tax=Phytophthora pseudosyringae TaxID=221518 RepID=A0A8T1W0J1_9STRA|nr:hypothetical protein PHYPSEUDO_001164 [Phytophthora pseudosyringae]